MRCACLAVLLLGLLAVSFNILTGFTLTHFIKKAMHFEELLSQKVVWLSLYFHCPLGNHAIDCLTWLEHFVWVWFHQDPSVPWSRMTSFRNKTSVYFHTVHIWHIPFCADQDVQFGLKITVCISVHHLHTCSLQTSSKLEVIIFLLQNYVCGFITFFKYKFVHFDMHNL